MRNILGVLFAGLFILGAGASIAMWRTPLKDGASDLIAQLSQMNDADSSMHEDANMMSGDQMMSGEQVVLEDDMNEDDGLVDTSTDVPLMGSGDIAITYGQLIPYIAQKYDFNADDKPDLTFTYIPQTDERYPAFKAAYFNRFFARTVNPDKDVSCDNYIVFIGLAEKRPVSYTASNVYDVFWAEAERR